MELWTLSTDINLINLILWITPLPVISIKTHWLDLKTIESIPTQDLQFKWNNAYH
jgi:hypothetical protein